MASTTTGGELRIGPIDEPDRYWLIAEQGRGGEAVLFRGAVHVESAGEPFPVAIKMLLETDADAIETIAARWRDQKEILHQLGVPGIVRVRDVFVGVPPHYEGTAPPEGRRLYLVMDWVAGESLADWLDSNPMSTPRQRLRFVAQLAGVVDQLASGATTGRPIVHGDIKPDNIIVTPDGPVLVDFGLARGEGARPPSRSGTAGYRAPEVDRDGEWSPASDRYALGAVAYFLLTGENPPATYNLAAMRAKLASRRDVAPEIADQVVAMLAESPTDRPESAATWAAGLRAVLSTDLPDATQVLPPVVVAADASPQPRRRRGKLVAALVVLLLLAGGAGAYALSSRGGSGTSAKDSASKKLIAARTSTTAVATTSSTETSTTVPDTSTTSPADTTTTSSADTTTSSVGGGVEPSGSANPRILTVQAGPDNGYLGSLQNQSNGVQDSTTVHNDGTLATQSIDSTGSGGSPKFVVWNLNGCYTNVRFTPGVDSDNTQDPLEPVMIKVSDPTQGGKTYLDQTYLLARHPPAAVTYKVAGVLRIRIDFISRDDNVEGVVGNLVATPVPTSPSCP